ncbi:MAG: hypothetical protein AB2652_18830, partial [Candidatus Thiodiazotropha endolucinida]
KDRIYVNSLNSLYPAKRLQYIEESIYVPTLCVGTIALIEIAAFDGVENVTVYESSSFLGVCIGT